MSKTKSSTNNANETKEKSKTNKPKNDVKKTMPRRKKNNQLTDLEDFDVETQLCFEEPIQEIIEQGKTKITQYRLNIYIKNKDGTEGDLLMDLGQCFSFGVQENTNPDTGRVTGHSISISLYDKDGPTEKQKINVSKIEQICNKIKEHIYNTRELYLPKFQFDNANDKQLRNIDKVLWWKKDERGQRVPNRGPMIYPKLFERKARTVIDKKTGEERHEDAKILTTFYDINQIGEDGEPVKIDATELEGKWCGIHPIVKWESIYFGAAITGQLKLSEADIERQENNAGNRSLLRRNKNDKDERNGDKKDDKASKLMSSKSSPKKEEKKDEVKKEDKKKKKKVVDESELNLDELQD